MFGAAAWLPVSLPCFAVEPLAMAKPPGATNQRTSVLAGRRRPSVCDDEPVASSSRDSVDALLRRVWTSVRSLAPAFNGQEHEFCFLVPRMLVHLPRDVLVLVLLFLDPTRTTGEMMQLASTNLRMRSGTLTALLRERSATARTMSNRFWEFLWLVFGMTVPALREAGGLGELPSRWVRYGSAYCLTLCHLGNLIEGWYRHEYPGDRAWMQERIQESIRRGVVHTVDVARYLSPPGSTADDAVFSDGGRSESSVEEEESRRWESLYYDRRPRQG